MGCISLNNEGVLFADAEVDLTLAEVIPLEDGSDLSKSHPPIEVGTGIQCLCLTFVTRAPAFTSRYFTFTDILHLWSYLGLVSGYSSSRLYKMVMAYMKKLQSE